MPLLLGPVTEEPFTKLLLWADGGAVVVGHFELYGAILGAIAMNTDGEIGADAHLGVDDGWALVLALALDALRDVVEELLEGEVAFDIIEVD